jgi:hypothetical protein
LKRKIRDKAILAISIAAGGVFEECRGADPLAAADECPAPAA